MKYTQEQIIQAKERLAQATSPEVVATEFKKTPAFNFLLSMHKDGGHWQTRDKVETFLKGELKDVMDVVNSVRYSVGENEEALDSAFRKYRSEITYEIDAYIRREVDGYRLAQSFEKAFPITGAISARRISNAPVPNSYAIKQDGWVQLATLIDPSETPTKLGDFKRHGAYDNFKDLFFSLPHAADCAVEYCTSTLSERARRGRLKSNSVVDNEWYLTDAKFKTILEVVRRQVKEDTYTVLRTNQSKWFSVAVRSATQMEERQEYISKNSTIVAEGLTYDAAMTLANVITNFSDTTKYLKTALENVELAKQRLKDRQAEAERRTQELSQAQENLSNLLDNSFLSAGVVSKVTDIIKELNEDEQATT